MTDLSELPAVPPEDRGGDERIGYRAGGIFLLVVGWGLGVIANIVVHRMAPPAGELLGPWRIYPALGVYALGLVVLGAVAGVVGIFMLWLARRSPPGKFVLPGYSY
jgi:fructose-specific phosphotransferase system IIC component